MFKNMKMKNKKKKNLKITKEKKLMNKFVIMMIIKEFKKKMKKIKNIEKLI
jgi:hypothetical protein